MRRRGLWERWTRAAGFPQRLWRPCGGEFWGLTYIFRRAVRSIPSEDSQIERAQAVEAGLPYGRDRTQKKQKNRARIRSEDMFDPHVAPFALEVLRGQSTMTVLRGGLAAEQTAFIH
jgi:hypothetical protein